MMPLELASAIAALRARKPNRPLDVRWCDSVPSTMDVAARISSERGASGVVVIADQQTAGRGRRGRTWESPPGAGIYLSLVWRPSAASSLPLVTLAAGVGVREGILAATGLAARVKWPNDLVVGTRKLAGILAEGLAIGTADETLIVGVGVNVMPAAYPPDVLLRSTSLESELGRAVDRGAVTAHVIEGLHDCLSELDTNASGILQRWRAASPSAAGTRVEWDGKHGITAGIDDSGALLVKTAQGTERVIAGELRWHL
jgi:BirA family biotin operon repressor/biotin-[acetyl-CoA-carboxylase] ligase